MRAARRVACVFCLAVLLILDEPLLYAAYRRRFTVSIETFRRDARMSRRRARYIDAVMHGNYRRCFYMLDHFLE